MQIQHFTTGGFVIHKASISGSNCRFSVWFDDAGNLLDAERISYAGVSLKATDKQKAELSRLGRVYGPR